MQILRMPLLACAAAMCLTPLLLSAYDNEAQMRARQALEAKMQELATQPVPTNAPPPVVVTKPEAKPKKAAKPAPAPAVTAQKPVAPVVTPAPVVEAQKTQPPAVSTPPPAVVFTPAPEPAKPEPPAVLVTPGQPAQEIPMVQTAPPTAPATPAASVPPAQVSTSAAPAYSPSQEKLQEALRLKMAETQTNEWQKPYIPPASESHQAAVAPGAAPNNTQSTLNLPPLAAPPSSLSAAKQQRLDQLLQLYRADQITPQEYHAQRAKILAEP